MFCKGWFIVALLLFFPGFASTQAEEQAVFQGVGDENTEADTNVTISSVFKEGFSIPKFIDGDDVLQFLSEDHDILDPGNDPAHIEKFKKLTRKLSKSKDKLEEMAFVELESQIFKLTDELEKIYQRLLHFSRVLVSLTVDEMLQMADILIDNQEYYEQVMRYDNLRVPSFLQKRLFDTEMDQNGDSTEPLDGETKDLVVDQGLVGPLPGSGQGGVVDLQPFEEPKGSEERFKQYWDPDQDYELLQDFLLEDVTGLTPNEKLNDLVQTAGIIKKIVHRVEDTVEKTRLLYKVFKAKKILKSKSSVAIFALIKVVEKIKRIVRHIKYCIIKHIKKFIKNFPFNVLWRLKVLIRLFIKILLQILWEVRYILTEILYKLYFLAKRLKKIPICIILYLKKLGEKKSFLSDELFSDGYDEYDDYWGEWDAWKEYDDVWDDDDDGWDDKKFMKFEATSGEFKSPMEIDELFEGFFDPAELKQVNKDRFNFDIVSDFNSDVDAKLDSNRLKKRTTEDNTTIGNNTISHSNLSNTSFYDSKGSSLVSNIAGPYFLACILVLITKLVFRFL